MPIYEYEPVDRVCLMCDGRIEVIQGINDDPCKLCPYCGMEVKRVVSRASINLKGAVDAEKAAKRGFSTFRRVGKGTWEKVAGPESDAAKPKKEGIIRPSDLEE
jgi:putative FmdB family regulatory protein